MGYDIQLFYTFKGEIKDQFYCSICLEILKDPVMIAASCQHHFCKICITEWLKNNNSCPNDRIRVHGFDPPLRNFKNLLDNLNMKCFKCCSTIKLHTFDNHEKKCNGTKRQINKKRLLITGLSPSTTDSDLIKLCEVDGLTGVTKANVFVDIETRTYMGFGFINFSTESQAEKALKILTEKGKNVKYAWMKEIESRVKVFKTFFDDLLNNM